MTADASAQDYHTVTPYLIVSDVPRVLRFLVEAFGAEERVRVPRADGSRRQKRNLGRIAKPQAVG